VIVRVAFVRIQVRVSGRLVCLLVLGLLDHEGVGSDRLPLHSAVVFGGPVRGRIVSRLIDRLQPSLVPALSAPISLLMLRKLTSSYS